jgi:hypothetical protein
VLASLENSPFAAWVRESFWGWPFTLTIHVLGNAIVVGLMVVIGLRLLGLFDTISYSSLRRLFSAIWIGFAVEFVSGAVLWMSKPTRYVADTAFVLKLVLVVVGVILAFYFYDIIKREATAWEAEGAVPSRGLKFAVASLVVWVGVVLVGRLTAHLGAFL